MKQQSLVKSPISFMQRLKIHVVTLPRPFALPAAAAAVALGCILGGVPGWLTVVAIICGAFLMFFAHGMNGVLDYAWTGLDKGEAQERSKPKEYTAGQQPIALGLMTPLEVFVSAFIWLVLSAGLATVISIYGSPWVWLPWTLTALCTFFYSWGKLHYLCEVALGLGFGSFAVMLGICGSANPDLGKAFLAGLPFFLMWGWGMETWDQAKDFSVNWDKGLRNVGSWAMNSVLPVPLLVLILVLSSYVAQIALVQYGILAPKTAVSLFSFPLLVYGMAIVNTDEKKGVLLTLAGCFVYMILLVVGQAVA